MLYDVGYIGPVTLGSTVRLALQCRNGSGVATAPSSAPTWSVYETSDSAVLTGSLGSSDADSKTGFRTGNLAATAGNGFAAGGRYVIRFAYSEGGNARAAVGWFNVI